ncbi:protoheme IX farnesyltransferase [Rathayibacter tritici]|uniref:Protoheme IX farnesyltransferase n=1 Tax=Rathayibacter tritici TaxID=33888 RepID=A0A160KSJ1_9MICO|nr:heme o synthase [Rathayibacter tritici]AND16397.1 protoheme IX farnesyltransferase [Rathayibacter tritici]PPF31694.1 protoheme IX farnesyltransferase [Rathayibacter tritici]PPF70274.1 protoheme IX farnesyltransferase [Rathayibacter tritici]PPG08557.1 protoheme IX farnesyltransferase [Rathayibacter tritici]PPI13104.1 protoheme IX farnesyltransferase [Rathayibacter tritici]
MDAVVETTAIEGGGASTTLSRKVKAFVALTKPRVIELLLVVTAPTMILAQGGIPDLLLVLNVLIGGALSAGSAGAFNCYFDRDIDRIMNRTKNRPLVTGVISDRSALVFATTIGVLSIVWLGLTANWLSAGLSFAAILIYVVFYTLFLKRRTPQNIVWGGIAGCMPVLIGWAAVTNSLDWAPVILFSVIFLWTPPHYWPLSMKYRDDYQAAGVPMLAVVRGRTIVGLQVILYAWAAVVCSLLLIPVAGMGVVYTVVALGSGVWFVAETHRLYSLAIRHEHVSPMRVFHGSIGYLTLLFLAVGIDPLLPF